MIANHSTFVRNISTVSNSVVGIPNDIKNKGKVQLPTTMPLA